MGEDWGRVSWVGGFRKGLGRDGDNRWLVGGGGQRAEQSRAGG